MEPDSAVVGSQRGSAGAHLEGDRMTGITLASGMKLEQGKGMGLRGYQVSYQVGCRKVSTCEELRLTSRVREAPGPAW
jgi:hypothetical protein